jgi:4'-phosphopantetheinyl transferase
MQPTPLSMISSRRAEVESLPEGEAHVWLANPEGIHEPALLERYLALLAPEERERHQRLRRERSRREFLVAHALARVTLSRYAPVPPEAWSFAAGEHGRPELSGPSQAERLRFNLSHTSGMVACAVIRELDIGVDVESAVRRVRHRELAERFFGEDEVRALRTLAPDRQVGRFLELWTLKEAYLKARGRGISVPLRGFQFQLSDSNPPRIRFDAALVRDDPASWQLALHHPTRTHTLALAIRRPDRRNVVIRLFEGVPTPGAAGCPVGHG